MSQSIQTSYEDFLSSIKLPPIFPMDLRRKIKLGFQVFLFPGLSTKYSAFWPSLCYCFGHLVIFSELISFFHFFGILNSVPACLWKRCDVTSTSPSLKVTNLQKQFYHIYQELHSEILCNKKNTAVESPASHAIEYLLFFWWLEWLHQIIGNLCLS